MIKGGRGLYQKIKKGIAFYMEIMYYVINKCIKHNTLRQSGVKGGNEHEEEDFSNGTGGRYGAFTGGMWRKEDE